MKWSNLDASALGSFLLFFLSRVPSRGAHRSTAPVANGGRIAGVGTLVRFPWILDPILPFDWNRLKGSDGRRTGLKAFQEERRADSRRRHGKHQEPESKAV